MPALGKILIIDDNEDVLFALHLLLEPYAEKVKVMRSPDRIVHFITDFRPDIVLLDMNFTRDTVSGQEGMDCLQEILKLDRHAVVVMMTAYADTDKAVQAIKAGATDFVSKPWENDKLLATLHAAMKLRRSQTEVGRLEERVEALSAERETPQPLLIGESEGMRNIVSTIGRLREADVNVLLLGENGTGKDVVARYLLAHSSRAAEPFVTIDVGAVPETLFESELFGYEKGAFTDARKEKKGRLELAHGGTLFLDEVGNLSPAAQSKLLTALEKRRIVRLGGTREIPIDVRLICATNADLHAQVTEGTFRQDLFYRINTVEIHIPPLRERGEDIHPTAGRPFPADVRTEIQKRHPANRTRRKGQAATVCLAGQRARTATCHRTRRRALQRRHPPCRRLPVARPVIARGRWRDPQLGSTGTQRRGESRPPVRRQHEPRRPDVGHHALLALSQTRKIRLMKIPPSWQTAACGAGLFLTASAACFCAAEQLWLTAAVCVAAFVGLYASLHHRQTRQIRLLRSFIRGIRHSGLKEIPRFVPEESARALGLEREIEHTLAAYRQQLFDEATRQKYYQLLLDHVDTGIVSCDGEGHVEWMNRAATAQVGTCRRVPEEWLRRSGPEARVVPVERHGQTKDLLLSPTRFTLDNRPRILFTLKDIHHVLEEQQLESWKTLTRVLTHEIMNSLTPILSLSETLTRQAPTPEPSAKQYGQMQQALEAIYRRSKGLLHFTENYRKLTRVPPPQYAAIRVDELFDDLKKLFEGMYLTFDQPYLGFTFQADRSQIEQVLINLITNARDASPSPESEIKIHLRRNTAEDEVQISVQDYGQGIPVEAQERIFVPFYTTKPNGSGIGLALCKQIVNQHHGYITLHSTVGKGSLFTLCLPRNGLRAPQT